MKESHLVGNSPCRVVSQFVETEADAKRCSVRRCTRRSVFCPASHTRNIRTQRSPTGKELIDEFSVQVTPFVVWGKHHSGVV